MTLEDFLEGVQAQEGFEPLPVILSTSALLIHLVEFGYSRK